MKFEDIGKKYETGGNSNDSKKKYYDILNKHGGFDDIDEESYEKFFSELKSLNETSSTFSSDTWHDSSYYSSYRDKADSLINEAKRLQDYLNYTGNDEAASSLMEAIAGIDDYRKGIDSVSKHYSQWASQEEWDEWSYLYNDFDIESAKSEVGKLEELLSGADQWLEDNRKAKNEVETTTGMPSATIEDAPPPAGVASSTMPSYTTGSAKAEEEAAKRNEAYVPSAGGVDSRNQNVYNPEMQDQYLNQYLKNSGYGTLDELREGIADKKAELYNATYLQSANFTLEELENYANLYKGDIAYTRSDGANVTWDALYNQRKLEEENKALYEEYSSRPDWEEKSQYKTTHDGSLFGIFGADAEYEEINTGLVAGGGGATWMASSTNGLYMTDEEKQIFNYLYHSEGREAALGFHESLKPTLEDRKYQQGIKNAKKTAEQMPVTATLLSALATPVEAAEALGDIFNAVTGNIDSIDRNYVSGMKSAIRGTVQENVDLNIGDWDAFDFLYGTGTSLADVGVASLSTPFGLGGVTIGLSAMGSALNTAIDRGLDNQSAFWTAAHAGLFEGLFEQVSLSQFKTFKEALTYGGKATALAISKSMLVNATEEMATEIANKVYDSVANKDFSQYETSVRINMMDGMSYEEAKSKVAQDYAWEVLESGASGALMGLAMTGSSAAYKSTFGDRSRGAAIKAEGADAVNRVIELGKTYSADTVAYKIAESIDPNKASAAEIGRLLRAEGAVLSEQNLNDIIANLNKKGFPADEAATIAKWMNKELEGGRLTRSQSKFLKENDLASWSFYDAVIRPNSTVNQRNAELKSLYDLASGIVAEQSNMDTDVAGEKTSSIEGNVFEDYENRQTAQDIQKSILSDFSTRPASYSSLERNLATDENLKRTAADIAVSDKLGIKGEYTSNDTGATRLKDTKQKVQILDVVSLKNGDMRLKVKDGNSVKTVSAKDVNYSTASEALVYEAVANMGVDAATAWSIIKGYNPKSNQSGAVYAMGVTEAYGYGNTGLEATDISDRGFAKMLSEVQRNTAHRLGKIAKDSKAKTEQKTLDAKVNAKVNANGNKPIAKQSGRVIFDGDIDRDSLAKDEFRSGQVKALEKVAEKLGITFHLYESKEVKVGNKKTLVYTDANGKKITASGMYSRATGEVWVDINAGNFGEGTILYTASHELTHFIKQWSPEKYQTFANFLIEQYGKKGVSVNELINQQIAKAKRNGRTLSREDALEEVVADSCESFLMDSNIAKKISILSVKDKSLVEKIKSFIGSLLQKLRSIVAEEGYAPNSAEGRLVQEMTDALEQLHALWTDALVGASRTYRSLMTMEENTDVVPVESVVMHSYRSLAEAAGFEAVENDEGRSFVRNGEKVDKVTVDDIENSPIGALINYSLDKNDISLEEANRQKKMFAEICTLSCKTNDFAMTMQFVGSAVFTGMKANADKQYGTTYDFPSICTKTQAVIDAMSARMVKLGRGLSSDELVKLYQDVFASGNPVPCPECYVFSRWIGIGGLLDNIKKYQDYYGDMAVEDVAKAYRAMRDKVATFAEEQGISFGKAKGALTSKLTKEYNKLVEKIEKAQNQGEKVKPADQKRLDELEPMMNTVKGMTWLENVYFADSSLKKVNPRFRVPNDVLFDLNNGETFATKYKEAWAFRTTQGAGYGKAITPYAEARLGEGILVTNNTTNAIKGKAQGSLDNYFLRQNGTLDKKARAALDRARLKQLIQAFIGGQRFQSTSDARYENASDYLLAALEMQAMRGMVQVYTKVDGAVPAFSAWGFSINQSLMPLGSGLDAKGNLKDTSVGGMNREIAFENRKKYETAGTITIGVNDAHIRELFKQLSRDFIIPYHASGGKADLVSAFRSIQEGQAKRGLMVRSTDYSRTQSDKVLSDEVLRWHGKTESEISRIHDVRAARIAILTGGKVDMDVVRSNRFLSALYDKLNGGEWDGVKLAKSKVESQIYPNEFWDQSVSYEDSGKITRDYLEYCEDLGFLHRFSGTVPSNGRLVPINGYDQNGNRVQLTDLAYKYENGQKTDQVEEFFWKVLTDRRMYGNDGKYLPQKIVTLNDTTENTVTSFAKGNFGRQYDKKVSMDTASAIADKQYSERDASAEDFVSHMKGIIKDTGSWGSEDAFNYVAEHPELNFIERIFAKDKQVKADLANYLDGIDDVKTLDLLSWYLGEAYKDKDVYIPKNNGYRLGYPYQGSVRTFRNAIKKRINAIMTERVGGTDLGVENGEVTLKEVNDLFNRLNSNHEIGEFAKKVFATADRLGVYIRFANQMFAQGVAGDQLGDMVEYKTSYFNDTTVPDQAKAKTILHELIHACTVYVMDENVTLGDVGYGGSKSEGYEKIANAATRLNRIYFEIKDDPTFAGKYGIKNAKEMVAELANEDFVALLKKKNLWDRIVDWICDFFGVRRGTSAYDNARLCVDYILDNPDVYEYNSFVNKQRRSARRDGYNVFGDDVQYSERTSNQELAEREDSALYIKNTKNANYIGMIFNGTKTEETRSRRTLDAFIGKDFYVTDGEYVYGTIVLGEPNKYTESEFHKAENQRKHRVPKGDEYDIKPGGIKWSYPIESYSKFDKPKKLSDSKEYKNSFQARQILYQDRDPDAITDRDILSNALLGAAKNNIEVKRLKEYGSKIEMLNSEERKLGELNEQIRALYSAKGKRDMAKLRSLKDERVKTENRINTLDKMLLSLEASKPLREVLKREKDMVRKREQEKSRENFAIYKSHQEERMEATREYYREIIRENARKARDSKEAAISKLKQKHYDRLNREKDRRDSTSLRNKIKAFKKKLEQNLLRPTERQYVPAGLAQAMVDVLDLIDIDTDLYKADGTINKAQEKRNLTKEKLQALKEEYEKLKDYEDPIYSGEFDDAIYAMLKDLRTRYEGRSLKEMDVDELYDMYDILRSIEETLADARKLIGKGEAADVYEAGYAIIGEQSVIAQKRKGGKRSGAAKAKDSVINLSLSPIRNIERMSGYKEDSALVDLFNDFEIGVRTKNRFAMDAYKDFEAITTGKNAKEYESAIYDDYKGKKYIDEKGRQFSVSKMQMMQAILSQDREKANKMTHIENGGLNFADLGMLRKGRLKDAISNENSHRVSNATAMVEGFREELREDKWAQEYMAAARNFFDGKAKDAVNETMLALKHRIVAKDKSYIPFEVDKNFIVREISAANDIQQTINSYGMLQDTKSKAPQPLIMTGLNNVLDRHIDQVATIAGLAIPVRNFNKVWNVHSVEGVNTTVNNAVEENWGKEGKKLIEQVVQDIQGPRQNNQSELYKKVKSGYIGATFLLNGSVVTKQIGSLFSATSMIRWRDPVRMVGNLLYTMANFKKISAEVDKYTASAWMRRQGMSDAEVYTLLTEGKKSKITRTLNKLPAPLNPSKWITAMDSAVALSLWKYCKADVKKAHPELEGEALNRATAAFYDTVIENTQSMTDVLHRPEIQKRNDIVSETFGMFKTDLYQMAGQLQNTVGKFNANKSKKNAKALGRTVYSIAASAVWGQLMTTVFALLRYKVNQYRDDEDELTVESWLKRQGFAFGGDIAGYAFPLFGSEVIGTIENIVYGESEDIADSLALTAINDLYSSIVTMASTIKDGEAPTWDQYKKLAIKSFQVFGIPANNILRTVEAVQLHAQDIANGEFFSFEAGVERSATKQINRIVDAYSSGEISKARNMFEDAVEELAERKAKDGEVGEDELNAARSQLKSELGSIYRDGEIDKRTAQDALSDLFGESEDDIYWLFDKWDYTIENGDSDDYEKYGGFIEAVSSGVNLRATIKEYTDNGVSEKTLASQITKHYKPLYLEMSKSERARLKGYLLNAYVLLGYDRSKKSKDIDQWLE